MAKLPIREPIRRGHQRGRQAPWPSGEASHPRCNEIVLACSIERSICGKSWHVHLPYLHWLPSAHPEVHRSISSSSRESNSCSFDVSCCPYRCSLGSIPSCLRRNGDSAYDQRLSPADPSMALRLESESVW